MKYSQIVGRDLFYAQIDKPWERRGAEAGDLGPSKRWPCKLQLSGRKNRNVIVVRCECMAETDYRPSSRFFGYDPIGEYTNLNDAIEAYKAHVREVNNVCTQGKDGS